METEIIAFLSTVIATVIGGLLLHFILQWLKKKTPQKINESKLNSLDNVRVDHRPDDPTLDFEAEALELPKEKQFNSE